MWGRQLSQLSAHRQLQMPCSASASQISSMVLRPGTAASAAAGAPMHACAACGKSDEVSEQQLAAGAAKPILKACNRCRDTVYCSRQCQVSISIRKLGEHNWEALANVTASMHHGWLYNYSEVPGAAAYCVLKRSN